VTVAAIGIDPGSKGLHGLVVYQDGRVIYAASQASTDEVFRELREQFRTCVVGIERCQSAGISGASLLQTSEYVGRFYQVCLDQGHAVELLYRRVVLKHLDISGRGNRDSLVRQRMLEMHPAGKGTKRDPGPLYGLAGHSWQALGVAVVALDRHDNRQETA
jgi:hypothetical protein